jgi:hypothetical protein
MDISLLGGGTTLLCAGVLFGLGLSNISSPLRPYRYYFSTSAALTLSGFMLLDPGFLVPYRSAGYGAFSFLLALAGLFIFLAPKTPPSQRSSSPAA